ncbi:hypothetical protein ABW19_dt0200852 [Dactylella cylindrospora]|nr:hypothetical protein ABW19_dt0200852 [Dactylella cylindrospora]
MAALTNDDYFTINEVSRKLSFTDPAVDAFMKEASEALGEPLPPPCDVFGFGDSPEHNDEFLGLALAGLKTGTTSWPVPDPIPWSVGTVSVVYDSKKIPRAVYRTTKIEVKRFCDVDEAFALTEAEGGYKGWRDGHVMYFNRISGGKFSEEDKVLCERFEIIYPRIDYEKVGASKD